MSRRRCGRKCQDFTKALLHLTLVGFRIPPAGVKSVEIDLKCSATARRGENLPGGCAPETFFRSVVKRSLLGIGLAALEPFAEPLVCGLAIKVVVIVRKR